MTVTGIAKPRCMRGAEGFQPASTHLPIPGTGWSDERRLRNPSLKPSIDDPAALLGLTFYYNR